MLVLVVDDNADVRDSLAMMVRMSNQEVQVASSGAEALVKARASRLDVVLVDIGMPDMDGFAVGRALRAEHGERLRLIAISGFDGDSFEVEAATAGFERYLVKPVDFATVKALFGDG